MSKANQIREQIRSIKGTQKITNAMELVAASKMRKAQERMAKGRPYAKKILQVIHHVAASHSEARHAFLQQREDIKRVGYIVVSSDRGLCGGLNINAFKQAVVSMKQWHDKSVPVDLCIIGGKAESFFKQHQADIVASTTQLGDKPALSDLIGAVKVMLDKFAAEEIDALFLVSNEFVNTMIQKPQVEQLLPLVPEEDFEKQGHWDYIYEPDEANKVLERLLIRYIESQVYQAVIENIACFMAAQMVAMKSATDNAQELIDEAQLVYNKVRQAAITQEISEIVSGAEAIS